jgi:hypothetical protein
LTTAEITSAKTVALASVTTADPESAMTAAIVTGVTGPVSMTAGKEEQIVPEVTVSTNPIGTSLVVEAATRKLLRRRRGREAGVVIGTGIEAETIATGEGVQEVARGVGVVIVDDERGHGFRLVSVILNRGSRNSRTCTTDVIRSHPGQEIAIGRIIARQRMDPTYD